MAKKPAKKEEKEIVKSFSPQDLKNTINKKFGDNTVMLGPTSIANVEVFPTGIASLDIAMGCNGIPLGRIIEVYGTESGGKTTTCLQIIAGCQKHYFEKRKRKGVAAFIDAEHALDPVWARNIGVNMDDLFFCQPSSGEEAFSVIEYMVDSGLVDVIVVDSVAALTPQKIIDGEIGDVVIGAQAQLMSKGLQKLNGKCGRKGCTIVFINQIRMKIGVMFGCLHSDTLINFVDGRRMPIKEVVNNRIKGDVWSYDVSTKSFVSKPITGWHHNGFIDGPSDFLSISLKGPGTKNGRMNIVVTPDHEVMTDSGWMPAKHAKVGSQLLTKHECLINNQFQVNGTLGAFLAGVLVGDSHIVRNPKRLACSVKIRDNVDIEYARWKVAKLDEFLNFTKRECYSGEYYESDCFSELVGIKQSYPHRDPMLLLEQFTWLGFAIWMMDDAVYERDRYHLSIKRFAGNFDKIEEISRTLDNLELYHHASKGGNIIFDKSTSDRIANAIYKYVPECMQRKLPSELIGKYEDFELNRDTIFSSTYATVVDVREASGRQMRNKGKYDITIDGTNCYSAGGCDNGVIIHNSPETTPGGRALKFYSSIRMDVRKSETIKEKELAIGTEVKVKIVKNKVAPPFTEAKYNICFGTPFRPVYGVDMNESLITMALHHDVIKLSGSSYKFGNKHLGNGKANSIKFLDENPEVVSEIRGKIYITPATLSPEPPEESDLPDSDEEEHFNMVEESDG